jgi:predicted nucleotidyltransferase
VADVLTAAQRDAAERVLAEEDARRLHFVVHLSGAHAYGFASADSDVDLKAIHVDPTRDFLGLRATERSAQRTEIVDGVEIDYGSNEIAQGLRGVLRGDGNMIERFLSASPLRSRADVGELADLVRANLCRRVHHHYRGFASSQRRALEEGDRPTVKRALYVLRTTLTGVHMLETGESVPDLGALCDGYGFPEAHALVELKRTHERGELPEAWVGRMGALLDRA